MKHGKNPTRMQKILMQNRNLNCDNWLVVKDTPSEMVIIHRVTNTLRTIRKDESN